MQAGGRRFESVHLHQGLVDDWVKEFIEKVKKKNDLTNQGELTGKLTYKRINKLKIGRKGVYV